MKIEKLNKANIEQFIEDLSLTSINDLKKNIDKVTYFGIKDNDTFVMGFETLSDEDKIAIIFIRHKLKKDSIKAYVTFLINSLSYSNHLIIDVYDYDLINIFDCLYKVKEITVSLNSDISKNLMKEKMVDIDMKTIRYFSYHGIFYCNLVKQNIQDNTIILALDSYFRDFVFDNIIFTIYEKNDVIFKELGYSTLYKSYVIS